MKPLGSVAAVVAAIEEDAAAEVDQIERDARVTIERIRDQPVADAAEPSAAANVASARARARTRLAQEDWEDTREAIAERERWLAEAAARGRERLDEREPIEVTRERLAGLVREAVARLPAGPVVVIVSDADAAVLDEHWCTALGPAAPDGIRVESGRVGGGCVVRSADGRASFDNSYDARAARLQAKWRSAIAAVYAEVTADVMPAGESRGNG